VVTWRVGEPCCKPRLGHLNQESFSYKRCAREDKLTYTDNSFNESLEIFLIRSGEKSRSITYNPDKYRYLREHRARLQISSIGKKFTRLKQLVKNVANRVTSGLW